METYTSCQCSGAHTTDADLTCLFVAFADGVEKIVIPKKKKR